jgi:uncharacterized Zn finger protein
MAWFDRRFEFPEYVSVATRRARARAAAEKIARKQKRTLAPVGPIDGNKVVRTFWGKAWCDNLESYRDYEHRLPRGRSYVRHGAVIDLQIEAGKIAALVSGTSTYQVAVKIRSLPPKSWTHLAAECTGHIDSLVDLLRGTLPARVMELVTRKDGGLFPSPKQISFECSCPDAAEMCKHVAATLYGVGVRMDEKPELFFELRGVDHTELVGGAATAAPGLADESTTRSDRKVLEGADLSALFGIEMDAPAVTAFPTHGDSAGNRSSREREAPRPPRAKSAKRAGAAKVHPALPRDPGGTRRPQKSSGDRNRR